MKKWATFFCFSVLVVVSSSSFFSPSSSSDDPADDPTFCLTDLRMEQTLREDCRRENELLVAQRQEYMTQAESKWRRHFRSEREELRRENEELKSKVDELKFRVEMEVVTTKELKEEVKMLRGKVDAAALTGCIFSLPYFVSVLISILSLLVYFFLLPRMKEKFQNEAPRMKEKFQNEAPRMKEKFQNEAPRMKKVKEEDTYSADEGNTEPSPVLQINTNTDAAKGAAADSGVVEPADSAAGDAAKGAAADSPAIDSADSAAGDAAKGAAADSLAIDPVDSAAGGDAVKSAADATDKRTGEAAPGESFVLDESLENSQT